MKSVTAIIPTLLKDMGVLNALVESLAFDSVVAEIIVINNSSENYYFDNPKVRVITEGKNLFVNPSWNIGVSEAKTEYVALVNDDIKIPDGFCSKVMEKFDDKYGVLGINSEDVINTRNKDNEVVIDINSVELRTSEEISIKPVKFLTLNFGIMMFLKKENYSEIPNDLKIFFGDDWILRGASKKGKENAVVCGEKIYHMGSLSSSAYGNLANKEKRIYLNNAYPFYKRIFNYFETATHRVFLIFGFICTERKTEI